jgi:hypothetical protein
MDASGTALPFRKERERMGHPAAQIQDSSRILAAIL